METTPPAGTGLDAGVRPRRAWVWPFKPSARLADWAFRVATWGRPLVSGWWWPLTAFGVGFLPLGLAYLVGFPFHHLVAASILVPILTACACEDRLARFLGVLFIAGGAHCALAIHLAASDPVGAAPVFPESETYWNRTHHWVLTGENPDYDPAYFLPLHVVQLAGLLASGYLSFGLVPLYNGLKQLDVMNFYVGRLSSLSRDSWIAVGVGWHPWSFLRVVGYGVLLFEVVSWSLERFTGRPLSTPRRRWGRWLAGLAFCLADALVKYFSADWVRQVLSDNLLPP